MDWENASNVSSDVSSDMDEMDLDRSNDFSSEDSGCDESGSNDGTKLKEQLKKIKFVLFLFRKSRSSRFYLSGEHGCNSY
jgi:hypothetical protein